MLGKKSHAFYHDASVSIYKYWLSPSHSERYEPLETWWRVSVLSRLRSNEDGRTRTNVCCSQSARAPTLATAIQIPKANLQPHVPTNLQPHVPITKRSCRGQLGHSFFLDNTSLRAGDLRPPHPSQWPGQHCFEQSARSCVPAALKRISMVRMRRFLPDDVLPPAIPIDRLHCGLIAEFCGHSVRYLPATSDNRAPNARGTALRIINLLCAIYEWC